MLHMSDVLYVALVGVRTIIEIVIYFWPRH